MSTVVNNVPRPTELSDGRMLAPVDSEGDRAEDFELTDFEHALAEAGTVLLLDAANRRMAPRPPEPEQSDSGDADRTPSGGGES